MDLFQDLEDGMKNIVGCICLMLIGGPIMMLVGVSYLNDATTDSRGMAIAEFKSDVSAWSAAREVFDDQAFSLKVPTETDARPLAKREAGDPQQEKLVGPGADLGSKSVDGDTSWAAWTPLFYQTTVTVPTVHTPIELQASLANSARSLLGSASSASLSSTMQSRSRSTTCDSSASMTPSPSVSTGLAGLCPTSRPSSLPSPSVSARSGCVLMRCSCALFKPSPSSSAPGARQTLTKHSPEAQSSLDRHWLPSPSRSQPLTNMVHSVMRRTAVRV